MQRAATALEERLSLKFEAIIDCQCKELRNDVIATYQKKHFSVKRQLDSNQENTVVNGNVERNLRKRGEESDKN